MRSTYPKALWKLSWKIKLCYIKIQYISSIQWLFFDKIFLHYIHIYGGWCIPAVSPALTDVAWLELKSQSSSQVWIQQSIYICISFPESVWSCCLSGLSVSLKVSICLSASLEQGSTLQPHWRIQFNSLFREVISAWSISPEWKKGTNVPEHSFISLSVPFLLSATPFSYFPSSSYRPCQLLTKHHC